MSADQPLLDRLAGLPPVPVSDLVAIFERAGLAKDPLLESRPIFFNASTAIEGGTATD